MIEKKLLSYFGLKWNPFLPNIPVEALWSPKEMESFLFRLENLVMDGGFALITGEPGLGKSKTLQIIANHLKRLDDVVVGVMQRPQSTLSDFYREMGDLFGVNLTFNSRYGSFKVLRERWKDHIKNTLFRPVLLIDEAQEMLTESLNEIRHLCSQKFDSECLLTTVICGDLRLPERFRSESLIALGSRIRLRLRLETYDREELLSYLDHSLENAAASNLIKQSLIETLVDHCAGNLRLLNNMGAELLEKAFQNELSQIDDKLFLETFSRSGKSRKQSKKKLTNQFC